MSHFIEVWSTTIIHCIVVEVYSTMIKLLIDVALSIRSLSNVIAVKGEINSRNTPIVLSSFIVQGCVSKN